MENKITDNRIDYEPKGCIKSNPTVSKGLYIFAGILIIAGVIVNFAVMSDILIILVFVFLAALSAFAGLASAKHAWYWDDEKFSILQLGAKPATYKFNEIDQIYSVTEGPAVTIMIRMKNGKQYGLSPNDNGTKEFLEHIKAVQESNQSVNEENV